MATIRSASNPGHVVSPPVDQPQEAPQDFLGMSEEDFTKMLDEHDATMSQLAQESPEYYGPNAAPRREPDALTERGAFQPGEDQGFGSSLPLWMRGAATGVVKAGLAVGDLVNTVDKAVSPEVTLNDGTTAKHLGDEKSQLRIDFEAWDERAGATSTAYSITSGISQAVTGWYALGGIGKLAALGGEAAGAAETGNKMLGWFGQSAAKGAAKGMAVDFTFFDKESGNLMDLLDQLPLTKGVFTHYLASDPNDGEIEGRFKNALVGLGLGAVAAPVFATAGKWLRAGKNSDAKGLLEAGKEMQELDLKNVKPTPKPPEVGQVTPPENLTAANDVREVPILTGERAVPPGAANEGQRPPVGPEAFPELGNSMSPPQLGDAANQNVDRALSKSVTTNDNLPPGATKGLDPEVGYGIGKPLKAGDEVPPPRVANDMPTSGIAREAPPAPTSSVPARTSSVPTVRPAGVPSPINSEITEQFLKTVTEDLDALRTHGGMEAAANKGYVFASKEFNWAKALSTPEDVQVAISRFAEANKASLGAAAAKGTATTDAALMARVGDLVLDAGMDRGKFMESLAKHASSMQDAAAHLGAAMEMGTKILVDARKLAERIVIGNIPEFAGDRQAAVQALKEQMGLADSLFSPVRTIASNTGRTLRSLRGDVAPINLDRVVKSIGSDPASAKATLASVDGETLLRHVMDSGGDVAAMAKLAQSPSLSKKIADAIGYIQANNLLWGWKTHTINIASNAGMMILRPLENVIGGGIASLWSPGGSAMRQQGLLQYKHLAYQLADGFFLLAKAALNRDADAVLQTAPVRAFLTNDSVLIPHGSEAQSIGKAIAQMPFRKINSIGDLLYNGLLVAPTKAIGLPTRALGAMDEVSKGLVYRTHVAARAELEGIQQGLSGAELKAHIEQRLAGAFDKNGKALDAISKREAQVTTFSQDFVKGEDASFGQPIAASYSRLVNDAPLPLRLITPFVKTPVNIFRYAVKLTPGLNMLQKEYRNAMSGAKGVEEQMHSIGQIALGSMFMGTAAYLAAEGRLTGGLSADPRIAADQRAAGFQPYSILVGKDEKGNNIWMSYDRFDPVATPLALVADMYHYMHQSSIKGGTVEDDPEAIKGMSAVALSIAEMTKNKTYLRSLTEALQAAANPGTKGDRFAGRTLGNLVPFSGLLKNTLGDGLVHETRGIVDTMMQQIGANSTLPPRRDAFGDIVMPLGMWNTQEVTIANQELQRAALDNGQPLISPPSPTGTGIDLRDVTMSDGQNAYERLQVLSGKPEGHKSLRQAFTELVLSEKYQRAADGPSDIEGTRGWMAAKLASTYHSAAMKVLMKDRAVFDAVRSRKLAAEGAYRAKNDPSRKQDDAIKQLNTLTNSLGLNGGP